MPERLKMLVLACVTATAMTGVGLGQQTAPAEPPGRAVEPFKPLLPQEVLVVANANAKGSAPLAKYYCLAREISEDRLLTLKTTSGALVGRDEYNLNIANPIREFLNKNELKEKVRCIVLVWGVPVRVLGGDISAEQRDVVSAYRSISERMAGRLAVNAQLLKTVGAKFPQPRTAALAPVGDLFEPLTGSEEKVEDFAKLAEDFKKDLAKKQSLAESLSDLARQKLALRQLAALRLDVYGMQAYLAGWPRQPVTGQPTKEELAKQAADLEAEQAKLPISGETIEIARQNGEILAKLRGIIECYNFAQARINAIDTHEEDASVDSELALLWESGYPLKGALPNPLWWRGAASRPANAVVPRIVMACRIDGPTAADALRIVKDSLEAEKTGLCGKFYIDAGGKYPVYDENLRNLRELIEKHTKVPVVFDSSPSLFGIDQCPDASMYVGWYSLQKYVNSFKWSKGAVAWHVASLEAMHLRTPSSDEWCVKMLQKGVAATMGAVNEPFLGAFPLPQDFYSLLLSGRYCLAECYWRTVPMVSWRLTLIADPLYNPFRTHPQLSVYRLPPELTGMPKSDGTGP